MSSTQRMAARTGPTPLDLAFRQFAPALVTTLVFSFFCNILQFVGPLFMLQVYDRVLSSHSESTLIALVVIATLMLITYALLDMFRSRVLVRSGVRFDETLGNPLFRASLKSAMMTRGGSAAQSLRDMDTIREFWTGSGVITMCDAPFAPLFVVICFGMHPYLGYVALGGAIVLFALAVANEYATRATLKEAARCSMEANDYATSSLRNAEVVHALGMHSGLFERWAERHRAVLGWQARASDRAGIILSLTKLVRQWLQIAILGTGAWLAIEREISPGLMIAASIMMGRALAPVEQAVSQWKSLMSARQAWSRIEALFQNIPTEQDRTPLPEPKGELRLENVFITAPGQGVPIVKGASFAMPAGETLALIGPSGAGKSTLARAIVGAWPVASGSIRLDGSDLRHWDAERLGRFVGYLPQDVELFSGTITENIARLGEIDPQKVIEAAELAGVHQIIQQLPNGYDTQIGEAGAILSGGQRQRVGLARAVYGMPRLIVLDEPNANLDKAGDEALAEALERIKARGTTIVLVTHKLPLVNVADKAIVLIDGMIRAFDTPDKVLPRYTGTPRVVAPQQRGAEPFPTQQAAPVGRITTAAQ
ncbi:MAG: type I secretion system permease/ATPase [Hyphomicrobiaceae bacterium]